MFKGFIPTNARTNFEQRLKQVPMKLVIIKFGIENELYIKIERGHASKKTQAEALTRKTATNKKLVW